MNIGHNLSLICQLTSEDIKQHFTAPHEGVQVGDLPPHCTYYNYALETEDLVNLAIAPDEGVQVDDLPPHCTYYS